jgi:hypothetical protein
MPPSGYLKARILLLLLLLVVVATADHRGGAIGKINKIKYILYIYMMLNNRKKKQKS